MYEVILTSKLIIVYVAYTRHCLHVETMTLPLAVEVVVEVVVVSVDSDGTTFLIRGTM